ncbi:MAG: CoA-binding protein [Candidatus Thorarchaeota archaeon]
MNLPSRPSISEMLDIKTMAIIGVSGNMGFYWAHSMSEWEHDIDLWFVALRGGQVLGREVITDLSQIPKDIDYAIISVPSNHVASVLKQCSEKGAKGVTIFSSGFSELGTNEGIEKEKELQSLALSLPTRVLGPNCMGITYPQIGVSFMPTVKRSIGNIGFLSQSGGVAIATYSSGVESGLGFSKVFSFGNGIDVSPPEILMHFKEDKSTEVIGAYIEGTRNGKVFYTSLHELAEHKPVVVLKGGRSSEGSRAAASHTGALAGSRSIWEAALRQANVPVVTTIEEMVATLSIFSLCPKPKSNNVGIVAISGGTSVIYTDLCVENGLGVPRTSEEIVTKLDELIHDVGTGLGNPIDLAADYYDDEIVRSVISLAGQEKNFDSLILEADVHNMYQVASIMNAQDMLGEYWKAMAKAGRAVMDKQRKPVLVAVPEIAYPEARNVAWRAFAESGLPVLRNMPEAIRALSRVWDYYRVHEHRSS